MEKTKITKVQVLETIGGFFEGFDGEIDGDVTKEDILDYVETTIAQLEAKAAKAKERAAKVKAEGDEIRDAIEAVLTDEFKPIAQIIEEVGIEDLTAGKVSARVGQLIKLGRATKADIKIGDRKVKGYALPGATVETEIEADSEE